MRNSITVTNLQLLLVIYYYYIMYQLPTLQSNSPLWSQVTALVITSLLVLASHAFVLEKKYINNYGNNILEGILINQEVTI